MLRSFDKESSVKNLKFVQIKGNLDELLEEAGDVKLTPEDMLSFSPFAMFNFINIVGLIHCDMVFDSPEFQKMLQDEKHFDVVIIEQFYSDCIKYLCTHYDAPCVSFSTIGASSINNYLVGNPAPTSYVPEVFTEYGAQMTFFERLNNFVHTTISSTLQRLYYLPKHNEKIQKYFPNAPHIDQILANGSLIFLNSHFTIVQPVPHMPNMVEVGGIHFKPTGKLPADIKKFLDEAKNGAILFSLGSNLRSHDLVPEKRAGILKALSKLKERVLWKFEDETLTDLPPNVKISKWLPQQDVLGHPNIKLFITHGGLLSLTESFHCGVPVVGIPFFGDQRVNMAEIERIGYGVKIFYDDLNEQSLGDAVQKVLSDPSYTRVAKKRQAVTLDRPMKPRDLAVYWVEYLAKHKTSAHMFPKEAMELSWIAFYQIDVVACLLIIVLLPLMILCKIFTWIRCKKCNQKKDGVKKSQ